MSKGVRIDERADRGVEIRYRRFRLVAVFLLVVGLGALGFVLMYFRGEPLPLVLALGGSLALTYWSAVHVFGSCVLRVSEGRLRVAQRPLPWWPVRDLPLEDVRGFEVKVTSSRSQSGVTTSMYHLHVETRAGGSAKLVGGVEYRDQVEAMKRALESAMGRATAEARAHRVVS